MRLDEAIEEIERCDTLEALERTLQRIVSDLGFACFAFVDAGAPDLDAPLVVATTDRAWDADYRANGFVHGDHVLSAARRTSTPFTWGEVPLPLRRGKRKPLAHTIMEAARDHGLREGLVVPFHFIDNLGRVNQTCCTFFWKDVVSRFAFLVRHRRHDLHLLMIYWAQRAMDIAARTRKARDRFAAPAEVAGNPLTDRERDVLAWAGRGKTMSETAQILSVGSSTVETHMRNAIQKLGAASKTHAVVLAMHRGYVDI